MCDKQAIGASMDGILKSEQFPMATQLCSTLFLLQERAYLLLRIMSEGNEFNRTGRGAGQYDFGGDDLEAPADKDEDEDEDEEEGEAAEEEEEEEEEENEEEGEVLERGVSTEGDIDGSLFDSDEAFARALQEKEDRDTTARLMALAGIHDRESLLPFLV